MTVVPGKSVSCVRMEVSTVAIGTNNPSPRGGRGQQGRRVDAPRVLFVEDDHAIADLAGGYLRDLGMEVTWVADGRCGLAEAMEGDYDLILLDVMLPGIDGVELCRAVRTRSPVPVLMVTALGSEHERVEGLDAGADDYIVKPFSCRELAARMQAVLRRSRGLMPSVQALSAGPLVLDASRHRATFRGRTIELTAQEFEVLRVLVERAGRTLRRDEIRAALSRQGEVSDRVIDVHVSRIRTKLGEPPRRPRLLKTVWGVGYVLDVEGEAS